MLLSTTYRALPRTLRLVNKSSHIRRAVSTLKENPHIYIHPTPTSTNTPTSPQSYTLSLLPTSPPTTALSLGSTTSSPTHPVTPSTFTPNPHFLPLLSKVLSKYAHLDPQLQSQAAAFATTASHFSLSPPSAYRENGKGMKKDSGAPPSASQGGAGSSGHSGYIHLSDTRAPPDYGRIAYPEDIFGSLEVTGSGKFVAGDEGDGGALETTEAVGTAGITATTEAKTYPGNWQESGSYRIVTREGIFGLTDFLREKLVEVLGEEEKKMKTMPSKSG
ncbi:hypothetical protein SBOR_2733 [Sclerotinia borealis F-4128]|uniref:Uncharacterized protein n=1 Tax=Sclerotinia borealis (strain F-4128) TaxID=1432307 RepID=W9CLI0_SCLBF|nr:hypothetical protein SBOR_2733 [Sclerotinia borealis F-4128]